MFDISKFDTGLAKQETGVPVEILDPNGEPTGAKLFVASLDSDRVKAVLRENANKMAMEQRKNPRKALKPEEVENRLYGVLVASVVSWEGVTEDGKPLPCTPENVDMLLRKFSWVAKQVDMASGDTALFFGN